MERSKVVATEELKIRRLKSFYRDMFPLLGSVDDIKRDFKKITDILEDNKDTILISSVNAPMKNCILPILMKRWPYKKYLVLNIYDLVDIYLGNHPIYASLSEIESYVLVITSGFGEIENKRTDEFLNRVLELQKFRGHNTIIYHKGNVNDFYKLYKRTYSNIKESNNYSFQEISLEVNYKKRDTSRGADRDLF